MKKIGWHFFLAVFIFVGCKTTYKVKSFQDIQVPEAPVYSDENSWAVLPNMYAESLQKFSPKNIDLLKADVFYVYPTLLLDKKDVRWNASIDDVVQNEKVIETAVKNQVSPFATSGKIYVPFYRQAHIKSYSLYPKG